MGNDCSSNVSNLLLSPAATPSSLDDKLKLIENLYTKMTITANIEYILNHIYAIVYQFWKLPSDLLTIYWFPSRS